MNKIMLPSVFMFFLASGLWAGDECAKSAEACKPQIKKITPFMAALKKAEKPPELKQGAVREIALEQGEPKAALAAAIPASAAEAVMEGNSADIIAAEPPVKKEALSQPAWLLAVAAFLGGLYYFLKDGKKKKRA
ncbi:MAG: hypothetical protein A2270_04015 [Elusimicrobia bacterium RIFOXYA12_FULL_51_18]|nr:MAG: hypothetical protein A2270_04015 [Elusimicrobia bacterium RIFOXYA12_FULL_51_18]OGS33058.1 MAG: hypothetical protein A2218_04380 [Elusimicrobia bacterium RIFOXYA2_FULL_53_38]